MMQVLLMFGPEYARACGIDALEPLGIYLPGDKNYPGKPRKTSAFQWSGLLAVSGQVFGALQRLLPSQAKPCKPAVTDQVCMLACRGRV